jgi:hypothetical protein
MWWFFYVLSLGVMYLAWCDFAIDPTKEQRQIMVYANLGKNATETLQWLNKRSEKKAWAGHWKSKLAENDKMWDRWRAKSRACSSFSLISRALYTRLRPGRPVNSAYYYDVLRRLRENVRILRPEVWRQRNWLLRQRTVSQLLFHQEIF